MWMILRFRPTLVLRMILVQPVLVFAVVDSFLRPIVVVIVASVIPSVGRSAVVFRRGREGPESALITA